MNPRFVSIVRNIAQIWIPALATLVIAVSGIWGLKYSDQIVATLVAFDTFLGVGLGITNVAGHGFDGEFVVRDRAGGDGTKGILNLTTELDKLPSRNELRFKVVPSPKVTTFQVAPGQPDPPAST
jgi:hypothetical protein